MSGHLVSMGIFSSIAMAIVFASGIRIIQPHQKGVLIILGSFRMVLDPGFRWVAPFISKVVKIDMRIEPLEMTQREALTKDRYPVNIEALIQVQVVDPYKAHFEVLDYRQATIHLTQKVLLSMIPEMTLKDIRYDRRMINHKLRNILDEATDNWGVRVDSVEVTKIDQVGSRL